MLKFDCFVQESYSYKRLKTGVNWICLLYLHFNIYYHSLTHFLAFQWNHLDLVGVIVLRFAKSEVFVVPTSESTLNLKF
jgi:hypothetical protein